jgi:predicted Zn-dependent peptidase
LPAPVVTVEPRQEGERRVTVESTAQPFLLIGYHRPNQNHKDDAVFDVLSALLQSGRTGILYRELVRDKQLALGAAAYATLPGGKYPSLFLFVSAPSPGRTAEENEKAWYEIVERLQKEKVDEESLKRVKTKLRASLIRQLDSNPGLAEQMAFYHVNYGNWRVLFTGIDLIDKVTADDVQRVAREYLSHRNRTVGFSSSAAPASKGETK